MDREYVAYYVETVADSSKRGRTSLFVLAIVSSLLLIGFWNSLQWSALNREIQVAEDVLQWHPFKVRVPDDQLPQFERAKAYWQEYSPLFDTKEKFESRVAQLYQMRMEDYQTLKVPIIGLAFHVEDLGAVGGVLIFLLLIVVRFCLARELENIKLSLKRASHSGHLRACYDLLTMRQVLHLPLKSETHSRDKWWEYLPNLLLIIPFMVQTLAVAIETKNLTQTGESLQNIYTFGGSIALYILIGVLVISCFRKLAAIKNVWEVYRIPAEKEALSNLLGTWEYKMIDSGDRHRHSGHCTIRQDRGVISLHGIRELTEENYHNKNAPEKQVAKKARYSRDDQEKAWSSEWADINENNDLRFIYSIPLQRDNVRAFCELRAESLDSKGRAVQLKGGYYVLVSVDVKLHGVITFWRKDDERGLAPGQDEPNESASPSGPIEVIETK